MYLGPIVAIDTAEVITELVALANELRDARRRGEELGLTDDELAFNDALEVNDRAVQALGDETLRVIARELADTVRQNATIDWVDRENARARMRVTVKRLLRNYGYPPDKQAKATETVLEQARVLAGTGALYRTLIVTRDQMSSIRSRVHFGGSLWSRPVFQAGVTRRSG